MYPSGGGTLYLSVIGSHLCHYVTKMKGEEEVDSHQKRKKQVYQEYHEMGLVTPMRPPSPLPQPLRDSNLLINVIRKPDNKREVVDVDQWA